MAKLTVTVPIKFSEKAQKDLYETCMAYKELAETRGAENAKLRELLQRTWDAFHDATAREFVTVKNELRDLGIEVDG